MNVELLDESIMGLISEVETSVFHLLDLKRRAKGSISIDILPSLKGGEDVNF